MIGSYTAYVVQEIFATRFPAHQDSYFFVALPLSFLAAGLVGLALEGTVIRFLYGRPLETLIVTWGIGLILQQCARLWFGDQTSVNSPTWLRGGPEVMPGPRLSVEPDLHRRVWPWPPSLRCGSFSSGRIPASRSARSCRTAPWRRPSACRRAGSTRSPSRSAPRWPAWPAAPSALIGTVDPEVGQDLHRRLVHGRRARRGGEPHGDGGGRLRARPGQQAARAGHRRHGGRGVREGGGAARRDLVPPVAADRSLRAARPGGRGGALRGRDDRPAGLARRGAEPASPLALRRRLRGRDCRC